MRQTQQQKNKAPNDSKWQIAELLKSLETGDRMPAVVSLRP
jgi:hypothetical protein